MEKVGRVLVVAGRVTCPRRGEVEIAVCLGCHGFRGIIQDKEPLVECAYADSTRHPRGIAPVPGHYLG